MSYVPRVNKLDALHLDKAVDDVLLEQQLKIKDGSFNKLALYQRQLDLIKSSYLWYYAFLNSNATVGQQLLGLEYDKKQLNLNKKAFHYFLTVLLPIVYKSRLQTGYEASTRLDKAFQWTENFYLIMKLWIFFKFCQNGKRPTISDNLLAIDLHSTEMKRAVSYGYMNRELLWNGFIEFLVYMIPMINFQLIRNRFRHFFQRKSNVEADVIPLLTQTTQCTYCSDRPTLPHHFGCGHIYCYYCVSGNLLSDSKFACVECGKEAIDVRPV